MGTIQTSVRFVRPPWAKELCQSPRYREDCSNTQYLEHGFGRVFEFEKAREFFSIQEFIFSSRLSAAAEFHHTIPFTTAKRPFFFHCESRFLCRWVFRVRNLTASSYQTFCRSIERYSN